MISITVDKSEARPLKNLRTIDTPFRKYLQAIGLTREALAAKAKLSDRTLHRLEHGLAKPKPATLYALTENLKLSQEQVKELFPDVDQTHQIPKPKKARSERPRASHSSPKANNLRTFREQRMLTRAELARMAGINNVTIYLIEDKQQVPRISTIRKLLTALDLPFSQVNEVFPEG